MWGLVVFSRVLHSAQGLMRRFGLTEPAASVECGVVHTMDDLKERALPQSRACIRSVLRMAKRLQTQPTC